MASRNEPLSVNGNLVPSAESLISSHLALRRAAAEERRQQERIQAEASRFFVADDVKINVINSSSNKH